MENVFLICRKLELVLYTQESYSLEYPNIRFGKSNYIETQPYQQQWTLR